MRAQELTESWIPERFTGILKKQGYKFLGQGIDQAAYLAPGGRTVLKIFGTEGENKLSSSHRMFLAWAKFCEKNSGNPFLPKFGGFEAVTIDRERYIMMNQEVLKHHGETGRMVEEIGELIADGYSLKDILNISYMRDWEEDLGINLSLLVNTLFKLYRMGRKKAYTWDMHDQNVMVRTDGTPVITDPWVMSW